MMGKITEVFMPSHILEISCDGGNTWSSFGEPVSEQEAIRKKSEIDHNSSESNYVDVRVVSTSDDDDEVFSRCPCGMCIDAFS